MMLVTLALWRLELEDYNIPIIRCAAMSPSSIIAKHDLCNYFVVLQLNPINRKVAALKAKQWTIISKPTKMKTTWEEYCVSGFSNENSIIQRRNFLRVYKFYPVLAFAICYKCMNSTCKMI